MKNLKALLTGEWQAIFKPNLSSEAVMVGLSDKAFKNVSNEEVISFANQRHWDLKIAWALDELAQRAILDYSLVPITMTCIKNHLILENKKGPPLGVPASGVLMNSHDKKVEKAIVDALNLWGKCHQVSFFENLMLRKEGYKRISYFIHEFGFFPKFNIKEDGTIGWD